MLTLHKRAHPVLPVGAVRTITAMAGASCKARKGLKLAASWHSHNIIEPSPDTWFIELAESRRASWSSKLASCPPQLPLAQQQQYSTLPALLN